MCVVHPLDIYSSICCCCCLLRPHPRVFQRGDGQAESGVVPRLVVRHRVHEIDVLLNPRSTQNLLLSSVGIVRHRRRQTLRAELLLGVFEKLEETLPFLRAVYSHNNTFSLNLRLSQGKNVLVYWL